MQCNHLVVGLTQKMSIGVFVVYLLKVGLFKPCLVRIASLREQDSSADSKALYFIFCIAIKHENYVVTFL